MVGIGFGPEFGPTADHKKQGFEIAMRGISMPTATRKVLFNVVRAFHDRGAGHDPFATAVIGVLTDVRWQWPRLMDAAKEFLDQDVWPLRWTKLGIERPLTWAAVKYRAAPELLTFDIWRNANLCRRLSQTHMHALLKDVAGWQLMMGDKECPAERLMMQRYSEPIAAGDLSVLPPFFPGDGITANYWPRKRPH